MKKTILALAAVATMVACSKDEIVNEAPKVPIAFGDAFVENTTRAIDNSYHGEIYVNSFKVYGTVTGQGDGMGTANIFNGDEVTRPTDLTGYDSDQAWTCDEVQYWIPNSTYNFTAIVDGVDNYNQINISNDNNGMPTSIVYHTPTQKDILLATQTVSIDDKEYPDGGLVKFTFDHLLSKVKFQVKNTMDNKTSVYSYKVSDIKINNAAKSAIYYITEQTVGGKTVAAGTWSITSSYSGSDNDVLSFGNVTTSDDENAAATAISEGKDAYSNYERLLVPTDYSSDKLFVTFTVQTIVSGTPIREKTYTKDVAVNLEKGNAYNFIISLAAPGKEINFTVEKVNEWAPQDGPTNVTVPVE